MRGSSRYDEKLHRILRESARIFAEKGYHHASVRDISSATGISLSGLYYYFSSKEELLFLIQSHCFETITDALARDLDRIQDPEARLRALVATHLGFFAGNMAEMKVLSHEGETLGGDLGRKVLEQKKAYSERVSEILAELSPERSPAQLRVATFSLFGMMNWIYTWYRPERDVPVEELAHEMSHIFLNGLRTPVPAAPGRRQSHAGGGGPSIWRTAPSDVERNVKPGGGRETPGGRSASAHPIQQRNKESDDVR